MQAVFLHRERNNPNLYTPAWLQVSTLLLGFRGFMADSLNYSAAYSKDLQLIGCFATLTETLRQIVSE